MLKICYSIRILEASWVINWKIKTFGITQSAFSYSKLKIKALEQGVKVYNKDTRTTPGVVSHLVLVFLLLSLNMQMPTEKNFSEYYFQMQAIIYQNMICMS